MRRRGSTHGHLHPVLQRWRCLLLRRGGIELKYDWASQDPATQAEWLLDATALIGAPPSHMGRKDGWTGRVDAAFLEGAPKLGLVALTSVGYEAIDADACAEAGIWVTNAGGASIETTADMVRGQLTFTRWPAGLLASRLTAFAFTVGPSSPAGGSPCCRVVRRRAR